MRLLIMKCSDIGSGGDGGELSLFFIGGDGGVGGDVYSPRYMIPSAKPLLICE